MATTKVPSWWWPASHRDGIAALDDALLDAEIAVLTAAAQDFFADDTFDSDVAGLLTPHAAALNALVREGDPRVMHVVRTAGELSEDVGIVAEAGPVASRREDYALAAGADRGARIAGAVATGTASLAWAAVPPAVFDAAENTVGWQIEASGPETYAVVGVDLLGSASPRGIGVRLTSGLFTGVGELDGHGRARFPMVDAHGQPVAEAAAWNHDWKSTTMTVGAPVDESEVTRQRVRDSSGHA